MYFNELPVATAGEWTGSGVLLCTLYTLSMFSLVVIYKKTFGSKYWHLQQSISFLYLILLCMLMETDAGAMAG